MAVVSSGLGVDWVSGGACCVGELCWAAASPALMHQGCHRHPAAHTLTVPHMKQMISPRRPVRDESTGASPSMVKHSELPGTQEQSSPFSACDFLPVWVQQVDSPDDRHAATDTIWGQHPMPVIGNRYHHHQYWSGLHKVLVVLADWQRQSCTMSGSQSVVDKAQHT